MKVYTVLIGNSDNKLTQKHWVNFAEALSLLINRLANNIYFKGYASPLSEHQNMAIVFSTDQETELRNCLEELRKTYLQDSIALVTGNTELIDGKNDGKNFIKVG